MDSNTILIRQLAILEKKFSEEPVFPNRVMYKSDDNTRRAVKKFLKLDFKNSAWNLIDYQNDLIWVLNPTGYAWLLCIMLGRFLNKDRAILGSVFVGTLIESSATRKDSDICLLGAFNFDEMRFLLSVIDTLTDPAGPLGEEYRINISDSLGMLKKALLKRLE